MTVATGAHHGRAFARGEYLRVINYHCTPPSRAAEIQDELARYGEHFAPVTMDDLAALFETGTWTKDRPGLIPVFYEGYRHSYSVGAPAAEAAGLVAWFPVATAFLSCPPELQETFARVHWIALTEEEAEADRIAMSWDEAADLVGRGHEVYPHTATHQGFDTIFDDHELRREVHEAKQVLEDAVGRPARAFAWLHGSPYGRSPRHDQALVEAGYEFLFSNTMIQRLPRG